jgi:transposase
MLRALLLKNGNLSSADAEQELRVSRPTARNWMKELASTGLAEYKPGNSNTPDFLVLSKEYSWLLAGKEKDESQPESTAEGVIVR